MEMKKVMTEVEVSENSEWLVFVRILRLNQNLVVVV